MTRPKPRLLIVDDDEEICAMLRTFFEAAGYEVETFLSSVGLFQRLESIDADLILLDVMMSWVDGYRVCEMLKQHPRTRQIPVLMISARSSEADIQRGFKAQAEDYFVKPFNLSRLRGRVDQLLTERVAN